jgi:hypothetical protein
VGSNPAAPTKLHNVFNAKNGRSVYGLPPVYRQFTIFVLNTFQRSRRHMTKKHPNDGPTFTHSTIKKPRRLAPSPSRRQAELDQAMRDAAKEKHFRQRMNEDPVGFMEETFGCSIAEYLEKKNH